MTKPAPERVVAIIGAGPAGMLAGLLAARSGAQVHLFDSNATAGRKLLVTGSGRCNLTNAGIAPEKYAGSGREALGQLFAVFGREELLALLREVGVPAFHTEDGWYYPVSESAAAVADALAAALIAAGVSLHLSTRINDFQQKAGGFRLLLEGGADFFAPRLVVAAGGAAYPSLGSTGALFPVLERLGHTVRPLRPALAPLVAEMRPYQKLQGLRLDARARVLRGGETLGETFGNLIFTQWGLNGPAVMDLSHLVSARPEEDLTLSLDLLAGQAGALRELAITARKSELPLRVLLQSALAPKAAQFFLDEAGLKGETALRSVPENALQKLLARLGDVRFELRGVRSFEYCQVAAGGVPLEEVEAATMQSRRVPGLFLAGETLDMVGPCGGYNLQFAFSSGAAAGLAAGLW